MWADTSEEKTQDKHFFSELKFEICFNVAIYSSTWEKVNVLSVNLTNCRESKHTQKLKSKQTDNVKDKKTTREKKGLTGKHRKISRTLEISIEDEELK